MVDRSGAREDFEREFSSIAGHRALDLVNTVGWRLDPNRTRDRLVEDSAAERWLAEFGICEEIELASLPRRSLSHLATEVKDVREDLYGALMHDDPDAAAALIKRHARWWDRARLVQGAGETWTLVEDGFDATTPAARLAGDAVSLLVGPPSLIRQCADEACGWLYLDTSPRRNRRWCAAEDCGARNRSRAYYRRNRSRS